MKKQHLVITVALVLVIVFLSWFIFSNSFKEFAFEEQVEGVLFVSNLGKPLELLKAKEGVGSFVVSPAFFESGSASYMSQSLALFNSVLIVKGKEVKTLGRVVDSSGNLLYCQSNDGNYMENFRVEANECLQELGLASGTVLFVELPDSSLSMSTVEVYQEKVVLKPKDFSEVSRVSFVVLKSIFPDAEEVIKSINFVLDKVNV